MSEVSNRFSEWKNWVQENLEGLFWTKFEPLPPESYRAFQDSHDAPLEDTGPLHRELKRFGAGNWRMRHRFNNFGSFVS